MWAFAHVMEAARIGADCNICDHTFVESGAVIGDRVIVKNNVLIWKGVVIEDQVFLGPNVVFTNDLRPRAGAGRDGAGFLSTLVRRGASIGANATILCGVTIGEWSLVGAGSVVIRDVAPYGLAVGNPARRIGWVCECGQSLPPQLSCRCGLSFDVLSEQAGLRPSFGVG